MVQASARQLPHQLIGPFLSCSSPESSHALRKSSRRELMSSYTSSEYTEPMRLFKLFRPIGRLVCKPRLRHMLLHSWQANQFEIPSDPKSVTPKRLSLLMTAGSVN